jgi:hypothetical protein
MRQLGDDGAWRPVEIAALPGGVTRLSADLQPLETAVFTFD